MKKLLLMLSLLGCAAAGHAQIQVTPDTSALNLADVLVGAGTNISNAVLTCGNNASGSFIDGLTTNLGMDEGIVLTSGDVTGISGPSLNYLGASNGAPGDPDLTTISGFNTFDACILEFDVTVAGTTLAMDYVFASEEYPEYVCSGFNDAFAFLVSGPDPNGGSYTNLNIATVPGTTTPVSINTINGGSGMGSGSNCITTNTAYYVDNSAGTSIAYDGFTTSLTATIPTVPGQTYHMRYAVADASDGIMDTGVFLEAGSLKSGGTATSVAPVANTALAALYPNPSNGKVNVYSKEKNKDLSVRVYNSIGQSVLEQSISANGSAILDLTGFSTGIYIVNISDGTTVETQRVTVQ
jgi:hypothetical protein